MRLLLCAVLATLLLEAGAADRSRVVRAEFQRLNPCPVNGATRGACPGFEADHIVALCAGGADHPSNMESATHHIELRFQRVGPRASATKRTAAKQ